MKISHNSIRRFFCFLLIGGFFVLTANAQTSVDLSFNTIPTKAAGAALADFGVQPDGKILTFAFGGTRVFGGISKNQIARLNDDGSLDNSFDCPSCDFNITVVSVQADNKIIIAGSMSGNGFVSPRIRRLNPDGSLDGSFVSPFADGNPQVSAFIRMILIQPDGKILVLYASSIQGNYQEGVYRLNPNGPFDGSFTNIALIGGRTTNQSASRIRLQTDGKILLGGTYRYSIGSSGFLYRYNADGSRDSSFELPTFSDDNPQVPYTTVSDFAVLADGSFIVVGRFKTVNSVSRKNIVKIFPAGNVDLSFAPSNTFDTTETPTHLEVLPNGKILFSTEGTQSRFQRLNADGSFDNTFNTPSNFAAIGKWIIDVQGRILVNAGFAENGTTVYRTLRLNPNGDIDETFSVPSAAPGTVSIVAAQADGKAIIGGDFALINNVARNKFARVNADGTLDGTFNPGSGFDQLPTEIIFQADGKILVGGSFTSYHGAAQAKIARINTDGSLDGGFTPIVSSGSTVNAIAVQPDGKIFIGGDFTTVNGQPRTIIARLNTDGSLDATFNPTIGSSNSTVRDIKVQSDGKVMVGGIFSGVSGFNRSNLVRLNSDGTLDTSFNAGSIGVISQIEIQSATGSYIVSGTTLIRLNNAGAVDSTFQSPTFVTQQGNSVVLTFAIQTDGSIILGGNFVRVNGTDRLFITRLKPDGTLDAAFLPNGANAQVNSISGTVASKVLIGGNFTIIGGVNRIAVARLNVAAVSRITPFDFDGDGRADVAVFRPSNGYWYTSQNPAINYGAIQFGISTDKLVPADYDGDGKTDVAVFRNGNWYILRSQLGFTAVQFGANDDVLVPADYDGDGRADIAVFRPSNGVWYLMQSTNGFAAIQLGSATDKPVPGDYNGDGKAEPAVYRPSNGYWYNSTDPATNYGGVLFGTAEDKPVPADYDGDGKTDRAVFRPSNGVWYLLQSSAGFAGIAFGYGTDLPVAADYDGDGKADVAVFRNGNWYLNRTSSGFIGIQYGLGDDKPIPNSFVR